MTHVFLSQSGVRAEKQPRRGRWRGAMLGTAAGVLAVAGCDSAPLDESASAADAPLVMPQGMSLQGMSLQGMSLQGMSLQGMSLQGMSLQGRSLQGTSLQGSTLSGLVTGDVLSTTDSAGKPVSLHIADVRADWQDPSGEITLYAVEGRSDGTTAWENVCKPDPWGERWAVAASGSWDAVGAHVNDPKTFTFACTSGVIAKCMRWGYKPWKSVAGTSLADYHQACTRMARADYCGDGTPHTQDGTMIDMYDIMGIQKSESGADFLFEAAWTPEGAYCISKERWAGMLRESAASEPDQKCAKKFDQLKTDKVSSNDVCLLKLDQGKKKDIVLYNRSRINLWSAL